MSSGNAVLLQSEALTVGALLLGGVGLVGADLNGAQGAVVDILTVVSAVVDGALDALIGLVHEMILPRDEIWHVANG